MSKPRTPENFPRMKVRGGRRRRNAEITRAWKTVHTIDWGAISRVFDGFGHVVVRATEAVATLAQRIAKAAIRSATIALWVASRNVENQWVATHQLPATVSPWAAPVQCTER